MRLLFLLLVAGASGAPLVAKEVLKPLPDGSHLALSTTTTGALRVRFLLNKTNYPAISSTMIGSDSSMSSSFEETEAGLRAAAGSLSVSSDGVLTVLNAAGKVVTKSKPLGAAAPPKPDICSATVRRLSAPVFAC